MGARPGLIQAVFVSEQLVDRVARRPESKKFSNGICVHNASIPHVRGLVVYTSYIRDIGKNLTRHKARYGAQVQLKLARFQERN